MTYLIVKPAGCSKTPRPDVPMFGAGKAYAFRGLVVVSNGTAALPGDWITFKPQDSLTWHDDEHYYVDECDVLMVGIEDEITC